MEWDELLETETTSSTNTTTSLQFYLPNELDENTFCIVVDTNIFLNKYQFIEHLINKNYTEPNHPMLIVPYVVLQELDNLKRNKKVNLFTVRKAIKLLFNGFRTKQSNVKGIK